MAVVHVSSCLTRQATRPVLVRSLGPSQAASRSRRLKSWWPTRWETEGFRITSGSGLPLIYDYYGFPPQTYAIRYDAPGAPDAPSGWPSASAPPLGLTRGSSSCKSDRRSTARSCAANAALSSLTSICASVKPVKGNTFCVAGAGPMPMMRAARLQSSSRRCVRVASSCSLQR